MVFNLPWRGQDNVSPRSNEKSFRTRSSKEFKIKGNYCKMLVLRGIAEEAPLAYKDIDKVVEVVHNAGLSKKVARLIPLAVIKGE